MMYFGLNQPQSKEEPSYEELKEVEDKRKELVKNGRSMSRLNILSSYAGTIMPHLLQSRQAWSTFLLYVILRILLGLKVITIGEDVPQINTSLLTVVGGFMSFFLVFFLSQAYSRFMAQYESSKKMEGRIIHLAYLAKVSLPLEDAWRLLRYINAAHILGYVGLSSTYNESNLFDPMNERFKLLTISELRRVKEIGVDSGAAPYQEVIGWCIDLLYEIHYRGKSRPYQQLNPSQDPKIAINLDEFFEEKAKSSSQGKKKNTPKGKHFQPKNTPKRSTMKSAASVQQLDFHSMQIMMEELLTFRNLMSSLFTFADQTFPFSYIHLTLTICSIYLPIFAYCTATFLPTHGISIFPHLLGALFVLINIIFVIGVREIGRQMIDPYGDDLQDLSVVQYLENGVNASRRLICGSRFASPGLGVEETLEEARPARPKPFSHAPFKYSLNNANAYLITNVNAHSKKSHLQEVRQEDEDEEAGGAGVEEAENSTEEDEEEEEEVEEVRVKAVKKRGVKKTIVEEEEEEQDVMEDSVDYGDLEMGEVYPHTGANTPSPHILTRPARKTTTTRPAVGRKHLL